MKTKILLLLFTVLSTTVAVAQYKSYTVGVKAGYNTNADDIENTYGGHAGGFINGVVNDYLQIGSEIFYQFERSDYHTNNMFNVNVLARFFPIKNLHLHTGFQLGIPLKQTVLEYELSPVEKLEEYSLLVGRGYSIKDIEVQLRYGHGVGQVKSQVGLVSIGYTIFKF